MFYDRLNKFPNEIASRILFYGDSQSVIDDRTKEVVILVPGNPGLNGFYDTFLKEIFNQLGKKIPVLTAGHLGHQACYGKCIRAKTHPPLKGNEHLYNLDAQVQHQMDRILEFLPKNCSFYLVGHSIGCWMILQMLKHREIKERTRKCFLLFPTIERMAESPNGKFFCNATIPLYPILKLLTAFIYFVPTCLKTPFIKAWLKWSSYDESLKDTVMYLLNPTGIEKIFALAKEEMERVRELDVETIQENKKILKFYYGTTDGWVPVKYYEELRQRFAEIDAQLDDKRINHAFVLESAEEMATLVANWIREMRESDL